MKHGVKSLQIMNNRELKIRDSQNLTRSVLIKTTKLEKLYIILSPKSLMIHMLKIMFKESKKTILLKSLQKIR